MPSVCLHTLLEFDLDSTDPEYWEDGSPTYWYEGDCPRSGDRLRLPRTALAEAIAHKLIQNLAQDGFQHASQQAQILPEGKMYGVLLVALPSGEQRVLKAFSGLLKGQSLEGWVPPLPGREQVALEEAIALSNLAAIKQEMIALQNLPERQQYEALSQEFAARLVDLNLHQQPQKQARHEQRQQIYATLTGAAQREALEQLDAQSRWQGIERRRLKQAREVALRSLRTQVEEADNQIRLLKQRRKALSRQLQEQLYAAYRLHNFAGDSVSLQQLMAIALLPTGTGDCCAPKLLHYAATQGFRPLAMAEIWWGQSSANGDKISGEFYGACAERCQPLMGFLLSGLPPREAIAIAHPPATEAEDKPSLWTHPQTSHENQSNPVQSKSIAYEIAYEIACEIAYEDEWLIAVNKPAGLLSVPGRYGDRQDSVLSRLRHRLGSSRLDDKIWIVHRLDQDTSGLLLLAKDPLTHRHLSQQFQQRQIHKRYEAILAGQVADDQGTIDLSLWADPARRPYQFVNQQQGKPSQTHFRVLSRSQDFTQVEFVPVTGRTHQLRVHAAHPLGLGVPILGDRLYGVAKEGRLEGSSVEGDRLYLHAKEICLAHPQTQQPLCLQAETPFALTPHLIQHCQTKG
ncbi:MAG: RluA family pseudouridine synthase [Oscillatoriophycideae cyanobacterium NC_groundwater_1537_Pr4_S-0.65um_50_18]|nr:RluA family pseudouridine synthase [Oscillatoriophycideae cyanobacterium NC_groundwater_1537_Pr4_S-0.65um_50_18]